MPLQSRPLQGDSQTEEFPQIQILSSLEKAIKEDMSGTHNKPILVDIFPARNGKGHSLATLLYINTV